MAREIVELKIKLTEKHSRAMDLMPDVLHGLVAEASEVERVQALKSFGTLNKIMESIYLEHLTTERTYE
jgi:hypothetical protein